MKRALRACVGALLALALAACGGGAASPEVPAEPYTVVGAIGDAPVLTLVDSIPLSEPSTRTLILGGGPEVDDVALLSVSSFSGLDGKADGDLAVPALVDLTSAELDEDVLELLAGTTQGSRIVLERAVETERGERMEIVVIDVLPTIFTGTPVEVDLAAENLPIIGQGEDGRPTASVSEGATEPSALRVVPLAKSDGRQVRPGDTVYAQYTVWTWDAGEVYASTWEDGAVPGPVEIDETFPGLRDGVLDQNLGSRVLILVPPELGIGTDSLVAVVDILAIGRTE